MKPLLVTFLCLLCGLAFAQPQIPLLSRTSRNPILKTNAVISFRHLTNSIGTGNTAEYTTQAFTPSANSLVVACAITSDTVSPDSHSLTSLHGTWRQLTETGYDVTATPLHRLSVWYLTTPSPVSSTMTNKFAGAATGCAMSVVEFLGVDLTQPDGSSAIRQFKVQSADATANPTLTFTAPLRPHSRNAVLTMWASDVNGFAGTAETDWVEELDSGYNTPATGIYVMYRLGTIDDSPAITAASADWAGVLMEIAVEK